MIELFVRRPAMTVMFIMVFVVMGIVSYFNLSVERSPKVDFPLVTIKTLYPGASPSEVETQIIKKIEDAIAEISEIKKINSDAMENFGFVIIEFEVGSDVNLKAIEVKDKVEAIVNDLPDNAHKPEIARFDPMVQAIVELVLVSDKADGLDLYEYADKVLKNKLTVVKGVASVELFGGKQRQINVSIDNMLLKKHYLSINDIIKTISSRNLNIPGGAIEKQGANIGVKLQGEFTSVDQLKEMVIVTKEGRQVKLKEVARVEDSHKKIETISKYNDKSVVSLSIKKLSDGDAIKIADRVKGLIGKLSTELPEGMELKVAYDSTVDIIRDNRETIVNIVFGIALTTIILFLFMGSLRVTIVAAIVIPTSLVSAFLLMDVSNFTINMMTLLAIATCLGTLIANAVVVIESVVEYMERGYDSVEAAVKGTKDVGVAVLASAGTNLVVFTPIGFMSGMVGQFMKQFGLTVVYATIFSIIASFSLTPMLCAVMLKKGINKKSVGFTSKLTGMTNKLMKWMLQEYRYVFDFIMTHKWKSVVVITILIFGFMIYPAFYLGSEFFSKSDEGMIKALITLPQGVTLDKTRDTVAEVEKVVQKIPELKDYLSTTGVNGAEKGQVIIRLTDKNDRDRSDVDIIQSLIPEIAKIPEAEIVLQRGGGGGPGGSGDITVNVYGTNYDKLIALSREMDQKMKETGYFRSIVSSYKNPKREIRFIPNDEKMTRFGLKNRDIGSVLRLSVAGNDTNIYKEDGQEYKINLELDEKFKSSIEDIKNINIITKDGMFPMSELGDIEYAAAYPTIKRRDKRRIITLNGYLSKSTAGQVEAILKDKFAKEIKFEQGYGYRYAGASEFMGETVKEINKAFILAVILTYMLLVAILNSFSFPFVILTSVFTSVVGVVLLLFFAEFTINIGSMMSIVMLVGLAVNNAILMIDYAIRMLMEGKNLKDALWLGVEAKFRTILMTSIAIIVGALPQLFDPSVTKASMGGVIVGGIIGSIVFTFIYIPIIFYGFEYVRNKFFGPLFVPKKLAPVENRVQPPRDYEIRPDA